MVETVSIRVLRVGRSADNDIVVSGDKVSDAHGRVYSFSGRTFVEDCGSTAGTTIGGTTIPAGVPFEVFASDLVELGGKRLPVPPKCESGKVKRARSLRDWNEETGKLGLDEALPILRQIAEILAFDHANNLVRPYLSTGSILVVRGESGPRVLLTDSLGRMGERITLLAFAPEYTPPEQFRGLLVDARRDVYALGVLAFEMLAGRLPFRATTTNGWARKHETAIPPRLEGVPDSVAAAVEKALQKDRKHRHPSVRALLTALTAPSRQAPASARPGRHAAVRGLVSPPPAPGPEPEASPCPACGSHIGEVAIFCTKCGSSVPRQPGQNAVEERSTATAASPRPPRPEGSAFHAVWSLPECRAVPQTPPHPHQATALKHLHAWHATPGGRARGGILVLPTGAGKTFTAVRFLTEGPLSEGYKVLWLAHTHHLLDQAFKNFHPATLGSIREPRRELRLRVVSGIDEHCAPDTIDPSDDVIIGTLQTVTAAVREQKPAMHAFLRAAGKKLFIVFDEAHHAPAPTYHRLIQQLQTQGAPVLGLTATPAYNVESRRGWLNKLFPDGILAQAYAADLIAAGILARPHAHVLKTDYTPTFGDAEYRSWRGSFRDIPEHIVDDLARNAERNARIAATYATMREQYGKTIIFADRWYQCEAIAAELAQHGVRAGSVFSWTGATTSGAKPRDPQENARVLQRFRDGQLDVLLNVRMLTEGTDVPDVRTVFLTRQTTSRILVTQMVGRALRGPKLGGTRDAYIVSCEDDWRQKIQWAGHQLALGEAQEELEERPRQRAPLQLISVDLVRLFFEQLRVGSKVMAMPFRSLLPVGWYHTQFDARVAESDDVEPTERLVMVYDDEKEAFEKLVAHLLRETPEAMADEGVTVEGQLDLLRPWREAFLAQARRSPDDLHTEILQLARHIAQRGVAPRFFPFEARADHDLDAIAARHVAARMDIVSANEELRREFAREDRFWGTLFTGFDQFRHFYDGCVAAIFEGASRGVPDRTPPAKDAVAPSARKANRSAADRSRRRSR